MKAGQLQSQPVRSKVNVCRGRPDTKHNQMHSTAHVQVSPLISDSYIYSISSAIS